MESYINTSQARATLPSQNQDPFSWPAFFSSQVKVVNKSKYGFELILPGYMNEPAEVNAAEKKIVPEQSEEQVAPGQVDQEDSNLGTSQIDFEEIDKLFSKINKFNNRTTPTYDSYGLLDDSPRLKKRPPQGRGRGRGGFGSRIDEDSDTFRSTFSKFHEENSESQDISRGRYKTRADARKHENAKTTERLNGQYIKISQRKATQASSTQKINVKDRVKAKPTIIPLPQKAIMGSQMARGEWQLVGCLRDLILHDSFSTERMKNFNELELDIVLRILRLRYKGAEYFRYPSRTKNINPENNKCYGKFLNEKKLLGEFWPLVIDEIKVQKHIWRSEKDGAVTSLFNYYHRKVFYSELKERTSPSLFAQVEGGDDALLVNLFAEMYLNFPQ